MIRIVRPATGMLALGFVAIVLGSIRGFAADPSAIALSPPAQPKVKKVDFNREVRPILAKNCFACHGADQGSRAKDLRLDRRDAAIKPLKDGEIAVVPGKPDDSELMLRVTEEDDTLRMPPKKAGDRLSKTELAVLEAWIAQGAEYAEHWAFVPPKKRPLPVVKNGSWPRDGIDRWILARLEAEGLKPSPEADPYVLLRRASLDLRGLPPTPDEIKRFTDDKAPGAYERAVDRFLKDPAYGERWARIWLDLARYADSAGYGSDPLRPNIWRFRDWVIDAFNKNMPYDRFTIEQIAGDLLPDATESTRTATAFHRNTMTNTEGGTDDEEWRTAAVKDRVDTTSQVWMGLTIGCAKCHTHKFDPISQEEYYRVYAIFNQTADSDKGDESPLLSFTNGELTAKIQKIDAEIASAKKQIDGMPKDAPGLKDLRDKLSKLEKSKPEIPTLPVMEELPKDKRRVTKILKKGNFLDPGEPVEPGTPKALHPLPPGAPSDRLALAKWLVDRENPLTARVAVNRFWAQLFGTGLVETEEDFGTQGEPPSHPELLDWLAISFMERGWDVKGLLKEIVTSSTYRQSSSFAAGSPGEADIDPRNRLLRRMPRYRLEAEMVRDQALALSGLLANKVGGPSVFPPQPEGLWQAAFNDQRSWNTSNGDDKHRRAIYTFWRRSVPYPSMAVFDAPSREICAIKRVRTNTPLQAFVTLNDPVYVEAAQALARRIVREGGATPEDRAKFGLSLCLCRPPKGEQIATLVDLFTSEQARYRKDLPAATALASEPLGPIPSGMDPADLAAWTTVANILLNLDGVLTKG